MNDQCIELDMYKVSIIHHTLKPAGGMERYALDLINALNEKGYTVDCYCRKMDKKLSIIDSKQFHIFPLMNKIRIFRDLYFASRVRRILDGSNSHEITIARMTSKGIAICGGTHPGFRKVWNKPIGLYDRLQIWLEKKLYTSARAIVAHSDFLKDEIVEHYPVNPEKIHVVYPPVDQKKFLPLSNSHRENVRASLGLTEVDTAFLFPSANHKIKGLDYISEVFEKLPDTTVLLVAGSVDESRDYPSNVRFLGYRTDIHHLYGAVDFTVLGSKYEAFGLVGIESILCGTKVILSDTIGCIPAITEGGMMIFPYGDQQYLYNIINDAVDSAKCDSHRINNPLTVLNYDPDINVHIDTLMSLLNKK